MVVSLLHDGGASCDISLQFEKLFSNLALFKSPTPIKALSCLLDLLSYRLVLACL